MSIPTAARLARRDLRGGLRGFRIFLACVILGVAAIAAVGTVRESIATGLERKGATLLGGDAEIEFTYRFANEAERDWMDGAANRVSEIVDFRSMAVAPDGERGLTQVKAVDRAYPLLGQVTLAPAMPLAQAFAGRDGLPGAVMHPLLSGKLDLQPGDTFRLGNAEFVLSAEIMFEPDNATSGFGLGPRTIVRSADLEGAGLLGPGTLYSTRYRLDFPAGADLAALQTQAEQTFPDSGLRWTDARNGTPGVAEFVDRLGAFLVLVGLSGLAVGGVGISAALRAYLATKTETIATLRTLGADRRTIFLTYFFQVALLALVGIVCGLALGVGVPVLLSPIIEARLPVPAAFGAYPAPMAEAALYSALTVLIFALWPLARAQDVRAAALFRDALGQARRLPRWPYLVTTLALLTALIGAAMIFSGNTILTLSTAGGIFGALILLVLAAAAVVTLARRAKPLARGRPALAWALAAIGGPGTTAAPVMLSLGLGLSVLAAVGQIDQNLRGAIARDLPDRAPSYFFVDIQKDQMPAFMKRLNTDPAVSRIESAPMLRGVISRINDRPATEVAPGHWVVEGDRGISYADARPDRTKIVAGEWWGKGYDGPPQISFAEEEAQEMGLSIGDMITVNILGRDLTAELTSLREVDFSTAGMGFVIVMNAAALEGAPHTFISTIYAEQEAERDILRDISDAMPNVTAISVRDAIDRVSGLLAGLASATAWGAAATLLTGFLVLIGAAAADQAARTHEAAILKTLGASRARILASLALRAAILGAVAGIVALAAGIAGGWAVSHFVMDTGFEIAWASALSIVAGGAVISLLAGLAFAWRPIQARPAQVLRSRE
ncbi:FtsX-like permease family protein [Roseovarius gahaiensis]|uniref:FtsX-like permease family protein n=1 Tax=Roseovarius gahaiensis TaxID=2716691 RepID=A0A967EJC2_9RHOB|nr:FtsX-like permease family protein [Roseovarius gahaiensis]NHQ74312.1 FtsX-like permease family protein [Roseovarius gahaiensis]